MLRVSFGAHRQVIFVPSSTNLDKNMGEAFFLVEQQYRFAWQFGSLVRM
jgi:hypothetical protein